MNPDLARYVWQRAQSRCEYCHLPVSSYPLRSTSTTSSLATAQRPKPAGRHPATGDIVRLFHPRTDNWSDHFEWDGAMLSAKSDIGLVTIQVLAINEADFVEVRFALMQEREFPLQ